MDVFSAHRKIIVSCANRIAPFLQQEMQALGFTETILFKTGVEFKGTLADCISLNLQLRTASQVYFSLKKMVARNADDLYAELKTIAWEEIIPKDKYFSISSNVRNETIDNNLFANVKVKDAIVDRLRECTGNRPDSGPMTDKLVFYLYWKDELAEIFIDTSGETLSKHGYRKIPGKAPMMESLAAAIIWAGKWDKNSCFINPMCGSGTLAIEAALMASGKTPGLLRNNYSFMHLLGYDEALYNDMLDDIKSQRKAPKGFKIIATDISEDAINIAKINAGIAGVDHLIEFNQCDFADTEIPEISKGVIVFNPEYGDRLGEEIALQETYKRMGDFLKQHCKGYFGYIFTGNPDLAKKIGLKASRRIEFFNGKIDCRLLEYELYEGSRKAVA